MAILAGIALTLVGCQTVAPGPAPGVTPEDPAALAGLSDDGDAAALRGALAQSLKWAETQPPERRLHLGTKTFAAKSLVAALSKWQASVPDTAPASALLKTLPQFFEAYRSAGADGTVLVTGYYVPVVEGSLEKTDVYNVPVYPVPDDLISVALADFGVQGKPAKLRGRVDGKRLVPYYDRAAIRGGALLTSGHTQPLAWVKDEFDLVVVEIQGSGVLKLPNGEQRIIGYADENGRPYKPLGKLLIEEGKIPKERMSMQAIRAYVRAHPAELGHIVAYNPSVVFFHFTGDAVVGSLGLPVTEGRTLATDQTLIPPGVPLFLSVPRPKLNPDGTVSADGTLAHLAFNQDTGGAIRGPDHVDYFWGQGEDAQRMAGMMRQRGELLIFVPKG